MRRYATVWGVALKVGIETVNDLRDKLKYERERVIDTQHPYDFFNFVVTAWHLHHDWMKEDKENRPKLFHKKVNLSPQPIKELIKAIRDLANGSKHFRLDGKNEKKKVVLSVHQPEVRDYYSYFFGAQRGVSLEGAYYSIGDIVCIVDEYFDWLFDDNVPESDFPVKLLNYLTSRV
ncbi:hypothetical protein CGK57_23310 [Vibrio parahaemolyticus]|nr:hypothetical protein CGK57_23310 [Vibrio parahaemolyticus]